MRHFIIKTILFLLPFAGLLLWYSIEDPFMVVRNYENYCPVSSFRTCSNDAFRGIRLMDQYKDSLLYNSFILGSSRSDFYYVDEWKKYLGDSAVCFHFNQSGDNLLGLVQRAEYLCKRYDRIDNVLIIIDHELLADVIPNTGPLFMEPYQVTPEFDFLSFHWEFVKSFFSVKYQKSFWQNRTDNTHTGYYNPYLNELYKPEAEAMIVENPSLYYQSLPKNYKLYKRDTVQHFSPPILKGEQLELLDRLLFCLSEKRAKYKVIVSPLFDQIKLNQRDSLYLSNLFSAENFHDFSGINDFTRDTLNYYENSHYRPLLCAQLLKIAYKQIDNDVR